MTVPQLEGVTVLADDVAGLASFYEIGLGLTVFVREELYVAFGGQGIRLAIFSRAGMLSNTHEHPAYRRTFTGQAFELNFECKTAGDVDSRFDHIIACGGTAIASPVSTAWGHYTAFFGDPEGNIHSLFAVL